MNINWMILGLLGVVSAFGQGTTNFEVRVNGDKVSLRARPEAGTEVVSQVHEGQLLDAVRVEGEWLGVLAPTNAGVWIKSQFVKEGVVTGDKIKMRSGPGISYRDVGMVGKGVRVTTQETHGDWQKVAPPSTLILWVNRSVVDPVVVVQTNETVVTDVVTAPSQATPVVTQGVASVSAFLAKDLPPGLTKDHLAPVLGQGALVERTGTVERVPLSFFRGVNFRLVGTKDGRKVTVCFVEGNDQQMPTLIGQKLTIKGRAYWLNTQSYPVIYPELLTPVVE